MGIIVNTVKDSKTGVGQVGGTFSQVGTLQKWGTNSAGNMEFGSKSCLVVTEPRNIIEGIA